MIVLFLAVYLGAKILGLYLGAKILLKNICLVGSGKIEEWKK